MFHELHIQKGYSHLFWIHLKPFSISTIFLIPSRSLLCYPSLTDLICSMFVFHVCARLYVMISHFVIFTFPFFVLLELVLFLPFEQNWDVSFDTIETMYII